MKRVVTFAVLLAWCGGLLAAGHACAHVLAETSVRE